MAGVMRVMKRFHSNARPMGFDDDYSGKSMSGGGGYIGLSLCMGIHTQIYYSIYT